MPGLRVISEKELLTSEKSEKTLRNDNEYLYNGKELDESTGWYFYGFRMYDPAIARFPSLDPKADVFAHVSPYNYAENEPIANIDLWGLQKYPVNPQNPWSAIETGFSMYFGGIADAIGNLFGGELNLRTSNYTSTSTSSKNNNTTKSVEVKTSETTTVDLDTYFYSKGDQGTSKSVNTEKSVAVEVSGKAGPIPVKGTVSVNENKSVETKATAGIDNVSSSVFVNSEGEVGLKGDINVPVSKETNTSNGTTTTTTVKKGFSMDLLIDTQE